MRWDDLDLEVASLTIRRSVANTRSKGVGAKDSKTHAERRLSLDETTVAVLTEHKRSVAEFVERCGGELEEHAFGEETTNASASWAPSCRRSSRT